MREGGGGGGVMRQIPVHQITASDLNTFTITFPDNMRNEVCRDYNTLLVQHAEVW